MIYALFPALKRWASILRAYGAFIHRAEAVSADQESEAGGVPQNGLAFQLPENPLWSFVSI